MEFPLENMYKDLIKFAYCSFDRMVIRGHVPMLQGTDGGGVVAWARWLDPNVVLTRSWFESFTARFHINTKTFAKERDIPIIFVGRNQDKNEIAKRYVPKDQNFVGVYVIMKSREMTYSFSSQKSKHNSNPQHRNITRKDCCVDHFYFYVMDKYWGPISIRFSSHLPFNVKVFLNGNRWLIREASKQGLTIKFKNNAITACDNTSKLQSIANSLNERKIQSVCEHWVYRLFPVLSYEERNRSKFRYQWFLHQIEYSHNMVFKNSWSLTKLFHRHIEINFDRLHAQQIQRFFGHRYTPNHDKTCDLRIHHKTQTVTVMRIRSRECSFKQYNKFQNTFRSELTINNVKDLKIRKSISNFNELKERMRGIIRSFQQVQFSVHQATSNRGELAALAKPGQVGCSHTAGIKLDNERIITVVALLPRLVQHPEGFRISDLRELLFKVTQKNYSTAQLGYDLRKLRAKDLLIFSCFKRRYQLTPKGAALTAVLPVLAEKLCDPLIGLSLNQLKCRMPEKLISPLDQHYYKIEKEIAHVSKSLGLMPA